MTQELIRRIDALSGCQGHWVLIENNEPSRIWWEQSHEDLFQRCIDNGWRELSLAFVPSWFGYSDYGTSGLVGLSNFRTFLNFDDPHDAIHEIGYGHNGCGIAVDIRFITDDMIESIQAVEDYPLLSDNDHSALECEGVDKYWETESTSDRVDMLQRHGLSVFAARHDDTPWRDGFDRIRENITSYLNEYPASAL
tara:strand:+ start:1249 stop:1833 length:585 start_codon:yes stop_codon:yes gene_type:complete